MLGEAVARIATANSTSRGAAEDLVESFRAKIWPD